MRCNMKQSNKHHDQDAEADKRLVRVIVINALLLLSFTALFLTVTSCQQAVQMQGATTRAMVVEVCNHD